MRWVDELKRLLLRFGGETPPAPPPGGVSCHEALERIFDWLDGELDAAEGARVGEHLETCARCFPLLQFERSFREAVRRCRSAEAPPAEMESRILHALEGQGFGSS